MCTVENPVQARPARQSKIPSSHPYLNLPMSNYRVAELTWENGQPVMNGLSGYNQARPAPIWEGDSSETLECIVHQATWHNNSGEKWAETSSGQLDVAVKKRASSEFDHANNMMTSWANSFDSTPSSSFKKPFTRDNSVSQSGSDNKDEDGGAKSEIETTRSGSSRRSRAAAVHNQSERRRRERINQKMKALQKLVPNASKTDKASMLDEVIQYLKQLQTQVQLMCHCNSTRMNMNMMMQQYQLQSCVSYSTTPFLPPPPFLLPPSIIQPHASPSQSVNMEVYNKIAQQSSHGTTKQ